MINIGLLGFGTVGTGVYKILESRKEQIKRTTGESINIKKVLVKNLHKKRDIKLNPDIITDSFDDILRDKDISIIIEVTGDLEESYNYITKSLKAGKHVVTANKKVASRYFEEFIDLANKMGLAFLYEGCVGGGIPVLKPLREQLVLNEITEVKGILNGTCNYILTRMEDGLDYSEALKIAQQLGFAELDPTDDVKGIDTRRKLRILGTLTLQGKIPEEDILLRGISNIKAMDIDYIKRINSTVKLIGEIRSFKDGYTAIVEPVIVRQDSLFYSVCYEKNAILLKGDNVGDLIFYGNGAGMLPTGNAVLEDVIDIITGAYRHGNLLGTRKLKNLNSNVKGEYYLRISKADKDILNILESIAKEVLCREENIVVMTRNMFFEDLLKLFEALEIKEDEYFLARRED